MASDIIMPEMGEGVVEGTIVQWLKHEGDAVKADEPVLEIETDKVTVEVNAEASGVLLKINVGEGETVSAGTVLAVIGEKGEDISKQPASKPAAAPHTVPQSAVSAPVSNGTENHNNVEPTTEYPTITAQDTVKAAERRTQPTPTDGASHADDDAGARVSPVVARMAEEHDIDLTRIRGTGLHGRITKSDVLAYLENPPAERSVPRSVPRSVVPREVAPDVAPEVAPHASHEVAPAPQTDASAPAASPAPAAPTVQSTVDGQEIMPLSAMRRSIAAHMVKSVQTSPHATTFFEFDFSAVAHHRAKHKAEFAAQGVKLTYMPYIVQAVVEALLKHPVVNGSWTDDGILLKKEINVGMAVAIDEGLIVPVIRRADELNLLGMARIVNDYAERARTNKLKPDEVRGGTFTVSNHGSSGSLAGTPIINQPQVGILGVGMIEKRIKVITDRFGADTLSIRPMAYVSFSFDHRILDGATADAFVMDIKHKIETWT